MSWIAVFSDDYRLQIPSTVVEQMRWRAGQQLLLIPVDGGLKIVPHDSSKTSIPKSGAAKQ